MPPKKKDGGGKKGGISYYGMWRFHHRNAFLRHLFSLVHEVFVCVCVCDSLSLPPLSLPLPPSLPLFLSRSFSSPCLRG